MTEVRVNENYGDVKPGQQTIFRRRDVPYTTLCNKAARDARLSLEARGFLVMILSYPATWKLSPAWVMKQEGIGRDKVRKLIGELEQHGYCCRERARNKDGTLGDMDYVFSDSPDAGEPGADYPGPENSGPGPAPPKKNYREKNKEKTNNQEKKKEKSEAPASPEEKSIPETTFTPAKPTEGGMPANPAVGAKLRFDEGGLPAHTYRRSSSRIKSPGLPARHDRSRYVFEGRVIKLNQADFDRWQEAYKAIPDLRAELQRIDDWNVENGRADKWFTRASNWLARTNAEILEKTRQRAPLGSIILPNGQYLSRW